MIDWLVLITWVVILSLALTFWASLFAILTS